MKPKLSVITVLALSLLGSLSLASSAAAEEGNSATCLPNTGLMPPGGTMPGVLLDFTVTPSHWGTTMQGQTATVTVTGRTKASIPLILASYKVQNGGPYASYPQKLHQIDRQTLDGCETITLQVQIPECYYQLDFVSANDVTEADIERGVALVWPIKAMIGGQDKCNFGPPVDPPTDPEPPVDPPTNPPTTPTTPTRPELPPVTIPGAGKVTLPPSRPVRGNGAAVCSSVTAKGYRVRAKQSNTISVRVKTRAKTRPTVRLRGAGVSMSRKVNAKGTVTFRVKPRKTGRIRVTASGCGKVASVRVLAAKRSQRSGKTPTFTG